MDLVKCRHCYGYVAPGAKKCLNCGTLDPTARVGNFFSAIAGLAILWGIPITIGAAVIFMMLSADQIKSADITFARLKQNVFGILQSPQERCEALPSVGEQAGCLSNLKRGQEPCGNLSSPADELNCRDALEVVPEEQPAETEQVAPSAREHIALPEHKPVPPLQDVDQVLYLVDLRDWSFKYGQRGKDPIVVVSGRIVNGSRRDLASFTLSCTYLNDDDVEVDRAARTFEWALESGAFVTLDAVDMGIPDDRTRSARCGVTDITLK